MKEYDLVVIGGGAAGLVSSKFAAGLGKKVALIEKYKLGGTCTLTGCIPSKTLIKSARIAYQLKHITKFGFKAVTQVPEPVDVFETVKNVVDQIYQTHTPEILSDLGIDVSIENSSFIDNRRLKVGAEIITAKKFIIATGSYPFIPPIAGLDSIDYLTNENIFELKKLPKSLIILGGGPIGIELASAFNRLGVATTVLELSATILPKQDKELVSLLSQELEREGITLLTGCRVEEVGKKDTSITVIYTDKNNIIKNIEAEKLLLAVGRKPALDDLQLENAGVAYTKKNIVVNKTLRTSQNNIYACGDVVGPYQFSHMAEYQAVIATRNALIPFFKQKVDYTNVGWITFTDPELASAGLSEEQARDLYGDTIKIYKWDYKNNDRARTDHNTIGLAKFICTSSGKLIGAQILGVRAGELINEVQVGKYYAKKLSNFYPVIHMYPTYSDIIWHASKKAYVDRFKNSFFLKLIARLFGFRPQR